ncbi:MAG: YggT family protein [Deltaproteobacteria bacterium]|nr:YggT family protein [Deltaproteobacteria bacterium]
MFVLANLIIAFAQILDYVLWAYVWILIGRVVISYVNADPYNPLVRFLHLATDPILDRVRAKLPMTAAGFDLSPIVVWLAVLFLQHFLVRTLFDIAHALR